MTFAERKQVESVGDCYFYHTIDIPGHGEVKGNWDLRPRVDDYLGRVSFSGKKVIEFGKANGFLTFEMERRGAEVTGYDLSPQDSWDVVPYQGIDYETLREKRKVQIQRLNNAFWFAHAHFQSQAKVYLGNIYNCPDGLGPFDIATFGAILLHTRDPFLALQRGLTNVRERVIITELDRGLKGETAMKFLPDREHPTHTDAWWMFSPEVVSKMIGVLGFRQERLVFHEQMCDGLPRPMFTVVGVR